jgi:phage shock protein A
MNTPIEGESRRKLRRWAHEAMEEAKRERALADALLKRNAGLEVQILGLKARIAELEARVAEPERASKAVSPAAVL